jgi:hypothetical protein
MGLESQLFPELFEQPLAQALLNEEEADVDMEAAAVERKIEMWMGPSNALALLESTEARIESLPDLSNKVEWPQKLDDLETAGSNSAIA